MRMLPAPLVPPLHALFQQLHLFLIRHQWSSLQPSLPRV
jgi:hypothetical protein